MPDQPPKTPPAKATTKPPAPDPPPLKSEQLVEAVSAAVPEPEPVPTPPVVTPGLPVLPMLPTVFTPATIATYVGSLAIFLIGVLVLCGVPIPAHVSVMLQTVVGVIAASIGSLLPLIALISHHSVQKAALGAGVPLEHVVGIRG